MKKSPHDRVSNSELQNAIRRYKQDHNKKDYNLIGSAIIQIAEKLANGANFNRYPESIKERMIGESILMMIKKIENYNCEKSNNPFAYFSSISWNIFRQNCTRYYKYNERHIDIDLYDKSGSIVTYEDKQSGYFSDSKITTVNLKR